MKLIVLLNAINAAGFPFVKYFTQIIPPLFLTGVRQISSALLLGSILFFAKKTSFRIRKEDLITFFAISLFGMSMSLALIGYAILYTTNARASFIYNLMPFITAVFSYIYFKEIMTTKKMLGLIVAFLGLIPIIYSQSSISINSFESLVALNRGELYAFAAVITWSYGWVLTKKLIMSGYHPFIINFYTLLCGGLFAIIVAPFLEVIPSFTPFDYKNIGLLLLFIVGTTIGYNLYAYLLKQYTATLISLAGFLMPLFAALYGWIFFNETVTIYFYISTGVVLIGLYLFYHEELRQGYIMNRTKG